MAILPIIQLIVAQCIYPEQLDFYDFVRNPKASLVAGVTGFNSFLV